MAAATITTIPMGAIAAMAGARVLGRLANTTVQVAGQDLCGILTDVPLDAELGMVTMASRSKRFACLAADVSALGLVLAEKTAVTLNGQAWRVRGAPRPAPQTGWLTLELERA